MRANDELGEDDREVLVSLTGPQVRWLRDTAANRRPPLDAGEVLASLVDEAIARSAIDARDRSWRLEVYRASGYPEHHPDYPNLPRAASDA